MRCRVCQSRAADAVLTVSDTHGRHEADTSTRYPVFRCRDCGVCFTAGESVDGLRYEDHYPANYHETDGRGFAARLVRFLIRCSFVLKRRAILRHLGRREGRIRVLDVGCGRGEFLEYLDPKRFDRHGVEVHPHAAQTARAKGLNVHPCDFLSTPPGLEGFDVVTLWNVLEHMGDPSAAVRKAKQLLNKGGILAVSVPNTDGMGFRFGKERWFHLDAPRHLVWFNPVSVTRLMRDNGFSVAELGSIFFEFPLDLFWSLRRSGIRWIVYPFYPVFKLISRETVICYAKDPA